MPPDADICGDIEGTRSDADGKEVLDREGGADALDEVHMLRVTSAEADIDGDFDEDALLHTDADSVTIVALALSDGEKLIDEESERDTRLLFDKVDDEVREKYEAEEDNVALGVIVIIETDGVPLATADNEKEADRDTFDVFE